MNWIDYVLTREHEHWQIRAEEFRFFRNFAVDQPW